MELKSFLCGLSIKMGTIIIGILHSIIAFIFLILSAAYAENPKELVDISDPAIVPQLNLLKVILIVIATGSAIQCVFSIFLIFGAETNRPILLLPWMSFYPICLLCYVLGTLIAIANHSTVNGAVFICIHLFIATFCCLLAYYKFLCVFSYYKHLRNLNF